MSRHCTHCEEVTLSHKRCDHCGSLLGSHLSTKAVALLGLTATIGILPACKYGTATYEPDTSQPFIDQDGDGYSEDDDCNDADETIHPTAEETVGDGIDSNCNDDDDT